MLQARGLSFTPSLTAPKLFDNLDISIAPGECVALVGPNGAGKSKLIQILAGVLHPAGGYVCPRPRIGYLPQDFDFDFAGSLEAYLFLRVGQPALVRLAEIEALMTKGDDVLDAYAEAVAEAESDECRKTRAAIRRSASRLGISAEMYDRRFDTLSLGERIRATIAALLVDEPEILLLDEPTNHLDVAARTWFESFLDSCPQGVLFACHDRETVDRVADRVLELDRGSLTAYTGGYSEMMHEKTLKFEQQMDAFERAKQEERRLKNSAEKTLQRAATMTRKPTNQTYDPKQKSFYAGKQKALDARAKAILKRVEHSKREPADKPFLADGVSLTFPAQPLRSGTALVVRNLGIQFGDRWLYRNVAITLEARSRVAIVGNNGSGKTTLFRALLGEIQPTTGIIEWAPSARISYLSQGREALNHDLEIVEALGADSPTQRQFTRTMLACLGIRGDNAHKRVGVLSVGERTKAELVGILASPANILLLDEPTNHLDLPALEALEEALRQFPGAILFTSHDRRFVERLATDIVTLSPTE
jgi:ATPase subunit of ABC transporter with duplicated ATPase domains